MNKYVLFCILKSNGTNISSTVLPSKIEVGLSGKNNYATSTCIINPTVCEDKTARANSILIVM